MPPVKKVAAKKATAKKAASTNRGALTRAQQKFEEGFSKRFSADLRARPPRPKFISTGSLSLDLALTVGGTPTGRIIELWGPEHAGKTTLAILMAVQYQREYPDKMIGWVDMEQTFDDPWAELLGLDLSRMYFYTPETAEDVADATRDLVRSELCSFVVLDSVGGMVSREEADKKDAGDAVVGTVAKIVTRMVKICAPAAFKNGTTICVINQVRAKIGGYGADEDTGGGWALKHVTTMKLHVRRSAGEGKTHTAKVPGQDKPIPVGYLMAVRVQKNKMGPQGKVAEIWLHNVDTPEYGRVGVDPIHETFNFAKMFSLMGSGAGGNYEVEGVKIKGGEPKVMEYLREHSEVVEALRAKVLATVADQINQTEIEAPPETESDDPLGISAMVD